MNILNNYYKDWKDYVVITFGSMMTAMSINAFLVPYRVAAGGVSGIATVIYYLTGGKLPVGALMLILNIPLFILGIRFIGKQFILRTLYATILLSVLIDITQPLTEEFVKEFFMGFEEQPYTQDILLYSIFGGFLMGIGLGLVFRSRATTGGTDLAARIVNHFAPSFTIGQILLFIDIGVILLAAVSFHSFRLALYSIVALYISSKVIDALLEGVKFAKALFIISESPKEIASRILKDLDRGVTSLKGKGMFTEKDKEVLFCVVHRGQIPQIKKIVKEEDEKAFIVLSDIREVFGEGFKTYE
ncbi:MAG: YitT family protein [Clostridium sp.]|jgi:uncharacterized membrane-anchored protein YitT (DUF2179 family)|nr:YitT family protein [Clostridium sp.]